MAIPGCNDLKRGLIADRLHQLVNGQCRRILLINPPQISWEKFDQDMARNKRYFAYPPYGIGLIRNILIRNGYEARIIDLNYYLLSTINSNNCDISHDIWKGYLQDALASFHPDIVGISCMFTMYYDNTREIAAFIKNIHPGVCVVAGGVCITNSPEESLRGSGDIDLISLFESDESFVKLLYHVNGEPSLKGLEQLAMIIKNDYVGLEEKTHPDQSIIDMSPDYGDIDIGKYSSVGECGSYRFWLPETARVATVLSNRGCRGHCKFCSVRNFYGKGVRGRSVECVVTEIESLINKYRINHISWLDDDLLFDKKRSIRLFKEMSNRKLDITWDASNGVIASAIDSGIMQYAAGSGCVGIHFGLETGSAEILKNSRKPSRLEDYKRAAEVMKAFPQIFTKGFLMIGFINETIGQLLQTIRMSLDVSLDWYTVQILSVLPATDMEREVRNTGRESGTTFDPDIHNYGTSQMGTQRLIESMGSAGTGEIIDYLNYPEDYIPQKNQLNDIWFIMDYRIIYERILTEEDPVKLKKYKAILADISYRMTTKNPLSHFFLGLVEGKLGDRRESLRLLSLSKDYLANHALWKKRFAFLGLGNLHK